MKTYFELTGGEVAMRQLAEAFYRRVFADPVLVPLFHNPDDDHAGRMALWLGEFFGGPREYSRQRGGFITLINAHHRLPISSTQRQHWIEHMVAACHEIHMPDEPFAYFKTHIELVAPGNR